MRERNYARFYALLRQLPRASKEELVRQYTDGRTESLREMTDGEYERLVEAMSRMSGEREALRQARSAALHQLQRYGIDTTRWSEVNAFVLQPRIAGKPFARLTVGELQGLTRKMRAILAKGERMGRAILDVLGRFSTETIYTHIKGQQPS